MALALGLMVVILLQAPGPLPVPSPEDSPMSFVNQTIVPNRATYPEGSIYSAGGTPALDQSLPGHIVNNNNGSAGPLSDTFHPSIAVIIGVLSTLFSLTFLVLLYAKHCKRPGHAQLSLYQGSLDNDMILPAIPLTLAENPYIGMPPGDMGLDRGTIEALPMFSFSILKGMKEGLECAVCLSRYESKDILRLLPTCKHAFHLDCIDVWLLCHSTCPLCRHKVDVASHSQQLAVMEDFISSMKSGCTDSGPYRVSSRKFSDESLRNSAVQSGRGMSDSGSGTGCNAGSGLCSVDRSRSLEFYVQREVSSVDSSVGCCYGSCNSSWRKEGSINGSSVFNGSGSERKLGHGSSGRLSSSWRKVIGETRINVGSVSARQVSYNANNIAVQKLHIGANSAINTCKNITVCKLEDALKVPEININDEGCNSSVIDVKSINKLDLPVDDECNAKSSLRFHSRIVAGNQSAHFSNSINGTASLQKEIHFQSFNKEEMLRRFGHRIIMNYSNKSNDVNGNSNRIHNYYNRALDQQRWSSFVPCDLQYLSPSSRIHVFHSLYDNNTKVSSADQQQQLQEYYIYKSSRFINHGSSLLYDSNNNNIRCMSEMTGLQRMAPRPLHMTP